MENKINLSKVIHKSNTIFHLMVDLFKVLRLFVVLAIMFVLVDLSKYGYDQGLKKFAEWQEQYVIAYIEKDLENKTFRYDDGKGTEKQVKNMSRDQLLKAFWIINAQFERKTETIQYIQDAINYK